MARLPAPLLAAPGIGIGLLLASSQARSPMLLLLTGLAGLFALAATAPGWIIAPLLLVEFSLSSYFASPVGMSLRLFTTLVCTALAFRIVSPWAMWSEPGVRRVLVPAVIFVIISTLVNMIFSESDYVIKYARYQLVQVLSLLIVVAALRSRHDLRRLIVVCIVLGIATAVASIWQHYDRSTAFYGIVSGATAVRSFKSRSIGIAGDPVNFPNHVLFVLTPVLALLAMGALTITRKRLLLGAAALLMTLGLYFSYTRSALLAAGIGVLTTVPFVPKASRVVIGAVAVIAVLAYPIMQEAAADEVGGTNQRLFRDASNDQSAAGHVALMQVGFAIAMDYPLTGVGHEHFEDIAVEYLHVVDLGGAETEAQGEATVGKQRPHNDWLSVWLSWGIGALLAYGGIFVGTFVNCIQTLRRESMLCRILAVGIIAGLAQYSVNSFLHNYLDSSVLLFVYAGVSAAILRIASAQPVRIRQGRAPSRRLVQRALDTPARRAAFA